MTDAPSHDTIRVLVADDDALVRQSVADLLNLEPGMAVVAAAEDADSAIELAIERRPDVAVLDLRMPGGGGARAAREILRASPLTRIVTLTAHDDRASTAEMIRAGAIAYVVKGAPISEIVDAVRRASRGLASLSGEAVIHLAQELDGQFRGRERLERQSETLRHEMRHALAPGAIAPIFQPIVDLQDRHPVGYEALARFTAEPLRTPERWFAVADSAGMRTELELAAIHAAVRQFDALPEDAYLSINALPETLLSTDFPDAVLGATPDRLVIEITEHAPVPDYEALQGALHDLLERGARLAIDDAGAGFASLRHILRLRPDIIKLDISLVRNIDTDRAVRALAVGLVSYAVAMGVTIVAEGIERAEELQALQHLGVRYGQGYFLGHPGDLP